MAGRVFGRGAGRAQPCRGLPVVGRRPHTTAERQRGLSAQQTLRLRRRTHPRPPGHQVTVSLPGTLQLRLYRLIGTGPYLDSQISE